MGNYLDDRRRRPRISTMILCELNSLSGVSELARVRDMSECGLKIASSEGLSQGDRVRVRLPGIETWITARVVWTEGRLSGLAFAQAVDIPQTSAGKPLQLQAVVIPQSVAGAK